MTTKGAQAVRLEKMLALCKEATGVLQRRGDFTSRFQWVKMRAVLKHPSGGNIDAAHLANESMRLLRRTGDAANMGRWVTMLGYINKEIEEQKEDQ